MLEPVIEALRRNDAPAALQAADGAVAAAPDDAAAAHLQGLARRLAGDLAGAREAVERAIALAPTQAAYHLSLGALSLGQRDLAAARSEFESTVGLDPNQLGAYLMLGHIALAADDREEARRQLTLAQRVDEAHPHVRMFQAQLLLGEGDKARALAILDGAVRVAPEDPLVLSALALAYVANDHLAFAEQALRKALSIQPGLIAQRRMLIEAVRRQQRPQDALAETEALLAQHPGDAPGLALRGLFLLQQQRADEALASFEEALSRDPANTPALAAILRLRQARGEEPAARDFLDGLIRAGGVSERVWQARGDLAERLGEDAVAIAEGWHEAYPDSALAMETLALRLEPLDIGRAEALVRALLARVPDSLRGLFLLYRIELARDPEAAIAVVDAYAEHPDILARADFRRARGHAHALAGRRGQALSDWLDAHEGAPVEPYAGPGAPPPETETETETAGGHGQAGADAEGPVLLWSPPGAGVSLAVELLRRQQRWRVMGDRLMGRDARGRVDGFTAPQQWLDEPGHPGRAPGAFAGAWRAGLAAAGASGTQVVDWLPVWDARVLRRLRDELPGARGVIVLRDPRDALLHWLAFGAAGHLRAGAPEAAARALASSFEHAEATLRAPELPAFALRYEEVLAAPLAAAQALGAFIGTSLDIDAERAAAISAAAAPPRIFAPGAWREYADVLGEAFAVLHPVAARLGYGD